MPIPPLRHMLTPRCLRRRVRLMLLLLLLLLRSMDVARRRLSEAEKAE